MDWMEIIETEPSLIWILAAWEKKSIFGYPKIF